VVEGTRVASGYQFGHRRASAGAAGSSPIQTPDASKGLGCRVEVRAELMIGSMPTVHRRPAAQQERDRLEARRLRTAEWFAGEARQTKVARQLKGSARAVSVWQRRWRAGAAPWTCWTRAWADRRIAAPSPAARWSPSASSASPLPWPSPPGCWSSQRFFDVEATTVREGRLPDPAANRHRLEQILARAEND
jgi:hypothetical protein